MTKKRKRTAVFSIVIILLIISAIWIAWENKALEINTYSITGVDLPEAFDGVRIAQVSDLHNTEMGKDNEKLISMLKEAKPNIIVITGDMIDSRNTRVDVALSFAEKAVGIAPCYFVAGNHESRVDEYSELKDGLIALGVTVLEDAKTEIELQGEAVTVIGVSDPNFKTNDFAEQETLINSRLKELMNEEDGYTILLSHRPELFETYVENGVDLVFSGHAHGGQFRIPFVGGVAAPNQGLFPEYDAGIFTQQNTNMVVSRGIGNSIFPFRVNNRPEVVLVELSARSE